MSPTLESGLGRGGSSLCWAPRKKWRAPRRLCGFTKVELKSGETKHVILALDKRSFSIYDTAALRWMSPEGTYEVMVGTSSRDLPLHSSVTVNATGGP